MEGKNGYYQYPNRNQRAAKWLCRCDCGKMVERLAHHLLKGKHPSCGCMLKKVRAEIPKRKRHGMTGSPEYGVWQSMIQRCTNPNNRNYHRYGGRGILICERWMKFDNFFEDMGFRPVGKWIDRLDNNAGYFPENCAWRTREEQMNNLEKSRILEAFGKKKTVAQWSRELGINRATLFKRIRMGWTGEKILSPVLQNFSRSR